MHLHLHVTKINGKLLTHGIDRCGIILLDEWRMVIMTGPVLDWMKVRAANTSGRDPIITANRDIYYTQ